MKRFAFALLAVAVIILSGCQKNYTQGVYELTITASIVYNDSVGNDWETVYTCNGETIASGHRWTVPLDRTETVTIDVTVIERDRWSDFGYGSASVVLTDGSEVTETVTVTEFGGRYEGNRAQWKITYRVDLIKKLK